MVTMQAGLIYFALVFVAGALVSVVRDVVLAPNIGLRLAELVEYPLLFLVIMGSANWTIHRFGLKGQRGPRAVMGSVAFLLAVTIGALLVLLIRGQSLVEYAANRHPLTGAVYLMMLGLVAAMPLLVGRRPPPV
ncbi:MAG: hypothetical protein EA355_06395 [Rhodobacteraceae bacterium]|nr:MAG: hypothetical protein EA355_06395 [Paracoccaceae bacterium]